MLIRRRRVVRTGEVGVTFGRPGAYKYLCTRHPAMTGEIDVS